VVNHRTPPNQAMEPTASRRTIQLSMNSTRQSTATRALICSFPIRSPCELFVYVAASQLAPFTSGG
jgi:hypothetical protein